MKKSSLFKFWGIMALATLVMFTACPPEAEPENNGPELPSALKNTDWKHTEGHRVQFGAKNTVTVLPASGSQSSFTLKDSQTVSELKQTTLWFGDSQTADFIVYKDSTISSVSLGGVQKTNGWSKDIGGGGNTYTVTFNINGGSGTTPPAQTITAGSGITLPSGNGFTKSGVAFTGWNTNNTGTGDNYTAGSSYTPTGSITLYAKWDTVENVSFSLQLTEENWKTILTNIDTEGKYVNLDLSACTASDINTGGGLRSDGTFDSLYGFSTGKDKIVSLILPSVATSIAYTDSNMFYYFSQLASVSAQGVTSIVDYVFQNCASLTNVSFPSVTSIGDGAFWSCFNLTSINFPSVTSIGDYAFDHCGNLTSVNCPAATSIGVYAFEYTSLTSFSFPVVSSIGEGAFYECDNLTSISFPATTNISGAAFAGCDNLTSFILTGSGNLSTIEGGKALVRSGTELIAYPAASGNITLTITSIGDYAFMNGINLTSASITAATKIGEGAFRGCINLTSVTLGSAAPTLGRWMYYNTPQDVVVTIRVPTGATGYGTIPATYSGTDTTVNWGNGFRGGGWNGMNFLVTSDPGGGGPAITQNITLHIVYQ